MEYTQIIATEEAERAERTRRLRRLRLIKEAADAIEAKRTAHRLSAAGFWDNIDSSGAPEACHNWTGATRWTHDDHRVGSFEYGMFRYEGCDSFHVSHVVCYATFGQEPPKECDVTPICGNYLCCNLDHLYITRFGRGRAGKIWNGTPARKYFASAAGAG